MSMVTKANEIKKALGLEEEGALHIASAAAAVMGTHLEPGTPLPLTINSLHAAIFEIESETAPGPREGVHPILLAGQLSSAIMHVLMYGSLNGGSRLYNAGGAPSWPLC